MICNAFMMTNCDENEEPVGQDMSFKRICNDRYESTITLGSHIYTQADLEKNGSSDIRSEPGPEAFENPFLLSNIRCFRANPKTCLHTWLLDRAAVLALPSSPNS